jgi:hypothetical protein
MRKAELRPTLDQIGHTSRAVLQTIENLAADQSVNSSSELVAPLAGAGGELKKDRR